MNRDDDVIEDGRVWGGGRASERRQSGRANEKPSLWPLAPEPPGAESVPPVFPEDRVYKAYDIVSRAERLHIVRATRMARRPSYHYLTDIVEDVFQQSTFALIYPSMIVRVTGRNLAEVVHAIGAGTCGRIREFHPKLYDPPPKDAPVIEEITVIAQDEEPTKQP